MIVNKPSNRIEKINSLLRQELNSFLQKENFGKENPENDFVLSITKVETQRDLRGARVFYTALPIRFRGTAKKFLESKAFSWQKLLGKRIVLKYIPRLKFVYDEGQENAMVVEKILSQLNK